MADLLTIERLHGASEFQSWPRDIEIRIAENSRVKMSQPNSLPQGVVYRIPGSALISICMPQCSGPSTDRRVLVEQTVPVAQFGPEAVIPIERRLFSDRKVSLEFGDGADLIKAKFGDARTEAPPQK